MKSLLTKLGLVLGLVCMAVLWADAQSTVTYTQAFSAGHGWTWVQSSCGGTCSNGDDSSNGNPSPSVKHTLTGKNVSAAGYWKYTATWQTLGVPAGSIVTQVDGKYDSAITARTYSTGPTHGPLQLYDGADSAACAASDLEAGATWASGTGTAAFATQNSSGAIAVNSACQSSSTSVTIRANATNRTGNNNAATTTVNIDNVVLVITYTARQDVSKAAAASPSFVCTTGWCKDTTSTFTQPSFSLSTAASTKRDLQVGASASLAWATGATGVRPGTGKTGNASGTFSLTCATCTDLGRTFTQPTLHIVPTVTATQSLNRTASVSFVLSTGTSGDKSGETNPTRDVNAALNFATQACIDLRRNLGGQGVGLATKTTYCLERSFPNTTLTFATSVDRTTAAGVHSQVGNVTGTLNLNIAAVKLANLKRPDSSSVGLSTSVSATRGASRSDSGTFSLATVPSRLRSVNRADSGTVSLATSAAVKRDLNRAASASFALATSATGVKPTNSKTASASAAPNFSAAVSDLVSRYKADATNPNFAVSVAVQRQMHASEPVAVSFVAVTTTSAGFKKAATAALNLATGAGAVKGSASTRRVLVIGAS